MEKLHFPESAEDCKEIHLAADCNLCVYGVINKVELPEFCGIHEA